MAVDLKSVDSKSRYMLKRDMSLLKKVNDLSDSIGSMTDDGLRELARDLRKRSLRCKSLDELLPEAFALVREASLRTTGLYPYDVQILGGIELYRGRIAEMKTGEGKTLVAAMPSFLMALSGKGVHVVTVNDYLAKRDAADIGRIHTFLGLSVGCVTNDTNPTDRKKAYQCDITYVTNTELGFDYLRDNMVVKPERRVQRGLHYCIIDEVDSILIDEARTPLIISGAQTKEMNIYQHCDMIASMLVKGKKSPEVSKVDMISGVREQEEGDYIVDEKEHTVHLTDAGVAKVEKMLGISNYSSDRYGDVRHHLQMALQAHGLMHRDKDYIVRDGEVVIVDEFTGRVMPGRVFSDGLHQAIEAKEHVEVHPETNTLATITYQNFFNKYAIKCGMTGTAKTSAEEFKTIYGLVVCVVPTNVPVQRVDEGDVVFLTREAKRKAVVAEILDAYKRRQPVLVGTTTIKESEILSEHLKAFNIPHNVLNAKYHKQEAEIISHAGEAGRITIATNMAGRGTDIKLTDEAREAGGLYVIGTERHEARRIDNQLRGRSGRQGDPGKSKFFLSLDDDVMRLFGSSKILDMLKSMGLDEWAPIEHKSITGLVDKAQKKIEGVNFGIRKSLLDFDEVNNEQRELIYAQRNAIMNGGDPSKAITDMMIAVARAKGKKYFVKNSPKEWDLYHFGKDWSDVFPKQPVIGKNRAKMFDNLEASVYTQYQEHFAEFGTTEQGRESLRYVLLKCIDRNWIKHLNTLEHLKQAVNFVGYGQKNPVTVYRDKSYDAFEDMLKTIQYETAKFWFVIRPMAVEVVSAEGSSPKS